mmetsp:Transcript_37356/g.93731  ORF Transcript_37356/g.93731 Transcript_37356/m.93731 type:complete len:177 (+) Transcript_37356:1381-1911(+)
MTVPCQVGKAATWIALCGNLQSALQTDSFSMSKLVHLLDTFVPRGVPQRRVGMGRRDIRYSKRKRLGAILAPLRSDKEDSQQQVDALMDAPAGRGIAAKMANRGRGRKKRRDDCLPPSSRLLSDTVENEMDREEEKSMRHRGRLELLKSIKWMKICDPIPHGCDNFDSASAVHVMR